MMSFPDKVYNQTLDENQLAVFWLGQAGFVFKSTRSVIGIDPYLSNCCERYFGFKRLMPEIMGSMDMIFDWIIVTHSHYDHFDVDAMPFLLSNGHTKLISSIDGETECKRLHLPSEQITYLKRDERITKSEFTITGIPCDHGELAPD